MPRKARRSHNNAEAVEAVWEAAGSDFPAVVAAAILAVAADIQAVAVDIQAVAVVILTVEAVVILTVEAADIRMVAGVRLP